MVATAVAETNISTDTETPLGGDTEATGVKPVGTDAKEAEQADAAKESSDTETEIDVDAELARRIETGITARLAEERASKGDDEGQTQREERENVTRENTRRRLIAEHNNLHRTLQSVTVEDENGRRVPVLSDAVMQQVHEHLNAFNADVKAMHRTNFRDDLIVDFLPFITKEERKPFEKAVHESQTFKEVAIAFMDKQEPTAKQETASAAKLRDSVAKALPEDRRQAFLKDAASNKTPEKIAETLYEHAFKAGRAHERKQPAGELRDAEGKSTGGVMTYEGLQKLKPADQKTWIDRHPKDFSKFLGIS